MVISERWRSYLLITPGCVVIICLLLSSVVIQGTNASALFLVFADFSGSVVLASPRIQDLHFNELAIAMEKQMAVLSTEIANAGNAEMEYRMITEIRDEAGLTIFLGSRYEILNPDGKQDIRYIWEPEEAGRYELRSFLISADCIPEILSSIASANVEVIEFDSDHPLARWVPALILEQQDQFTRQEIETIANEFSVADDIRSEGDDPEYARLEAKEHRIRNLIWSDERIKRYQETVWHFGYDSYFAMDERSYCDDAKMTIELTREHHVEGDWQTSYISTLSGRSELSVTVADGKIVSIAENPVNDTTTVFDFTEEQKGAIRLVLNDHEVMDALKGREDWYVGGVRIGINLGYHDCSANGCGYVVITLDIVKKSYLTAFVDMEQDSVLRVQIFEG